MGDNKTTSLNLREFPEDLHRKAKAKAALMGISLKELIIRAITEYIKKAN
jgi:predicted HicB family RNase H-like nuclease